MDPFAEIEQFVRFEMPEDYKYFLKNYHAFEGFIGNEYIKLWDCDELIRNNIAYQIDKNLPYTLAIGTNGSGEFIGIEKVLYSDYRLIISPFIDLSAAYHIEIGTSFFDMLHRLDSGKNWFG
ncbi:MAG TPA: SMI1/KNR4 family protein [Mucilaginibacter sp.]|nr:SMI1/KNR4 family protein [Mucilaginibacter sp.]